ncbi:MAG: hypothetical protein Q9217_005111 [Psora testacea]
MSWLSNLISSSAPSASQFTHTSSHEPPRFSKVQEYVEQPDCRLAGEGVRSDVQSMEEEEDIRSPYWHCMLAGGVGGSSGDMLMHSIDTVKTRQQGDPHIPPKYGSLSSTYLKIFRQEGFRRGLYSGVTPAFLGSFPGTIIFFGTYEYSKRNLIDAGLHHSLAYLAGGFIADFGASFIYVPSEVLKTRLQLQGRYNNPSFNSGYNYRGTLDAARTIIRQEGIYALFYGYKATIFRDLPFSALQFAFYEQEQIWARTYVGNRDIGLGLEISTAASAGGLAGVITCPLDVVKTRIQTQINPTEVASAAPPASNIQQPQRLLKAIADGKPMHHHRLHEMLSSIPKRHISTSSPNTTMPRPGAVKLDTSSVVTGLMLIYKTEGVVGLFRGIGPRAKQRKGDLTEIAQHVGLSNYEKMRKSELEVAIEDYLRSNASRYENDPTTAPFYQGVDPASPVKHKGGKAIAGGMKEEEKKPRPRRQTLKAKNELEGSDSDLHTAITQRTPAKALSLARHVPLPPSPAVIANQIDAQTSSMRNSMTKYIHTSGLPQYATSARRGLSNVTSIELLIIFIEAWGLRTEVLPLRYLATTPAIPALGLNAIHVKAPDLFALLTAAFWGPVGLWSLTSIFLPLIGGWFINLKGDGGYDSVSFNVVKALAAWTAYARRGVSGDSARTVERAIPGGCTGLLVGAFIGGLAGLYEAVLRK